MRHKIRTISCIGLLFVFLVACTLDHQDGDVVDIPTLQPSEETSPSPVSIGDVTRHPSITPTPGVVIQGTVLYEDGMPVEGAIVCRAFAHYPGLPVATTNSSGEFQTDLLFIPGTENVIIWIFGDGLRFEPKHYSWLHYPGLEVKSIKFTAYPSIEESDVDPECRYGGG
jgi:hypothetical protein